MTDRHSKLPRTGRFPGSWLTGAVVVLVMVWGGVAGATATSLTLSWDPVLEPDAQGYMVHYGLASGSYTEQLDAGPSTTVEISSLVSGTTYFFAVTVYNIEGIESLPSDEIAHMVTVQPPVSLVVVALQAGPEPGNGDLVVTNLGRLDDGSCHFTIEARLAGSLTIYESNDLLSWRALGTLANPTGVLLVRDLASIGLERRFYRVEPDP